MMKSGSLRGATIALINGVAPSGQVAPVDEPPSNTIKVAVAATLALATLITIGVAVANEQR